MPTRIPFVRDPRRGVLTPATVCRKCGAPIYWSMTPAGKRAPYDLHDGEPSHTAHLSTCRVHNQEVLAR